MVPICISIYFTSLHFTHIYISVFVCINYTLIVYMWPWTATSNFTCFFFTCYFTAFNLLYRLRFNWQIRTKFRYNLFPSSFFLCARGHTNIFSHASTWTDHLLWFDADLLTVCLLSEYVGKFIHPGTRVDEFRVIKSKLVLWAGL